MAEHEPLHLHALAFTRPSARLVVVKGCLVSNTARLATCAPATEQCKTTAAACGELRCGVAMCGRGTKHLLNKHGGETPFAPNTHACVRRAREHATSMRHPHQKERIGRLGL
jgi:hypothetical protein